MAFCTAVKGGLLQEALRESELGMFQEQREPASLGLILAFRLAH